MYTKQLIFFILLSFPIIIFSIQPCQENQNNCLQCHPSGHICIKCLNNLFIPNEKGGCDPLKKCTLGENYCNNCDSIQNLCLNCELGYYPDENGGCSYTDNCKISLQGECLECSENYILIEATKFCKNIFLEDFKNCKLINTITGKCDICEENYFLNLEDKKCIDKEFCLKSTLGVCQQCIEGYYLDKRDDNCKEWNSNLINCKMSLDGNSCEQCLENYFFLEDEKKCASINFCKNINENYECENCISGYFLTKSKNACTIEKNCITGDKNYGICTLCPFGFYIDLKDGLCKSNQENNQFKNCDKVYDNCQTCDYHYYLSGDYKCINTPYCSLTENDYCVSCNENYYLTSENLCTNIEHCIHLHNNAYYDKETSSACDECEDGYYFNKTSTKCEKYIENFENCKITDYNGIYCLWCKTGYYLFKNDSLCYDNTEPGPFYKCAKTDDEGNYCYYCEKNYYASNDEHLCTKIKNCALSENENKCLQCMDGYCLDVKKQTCEENCYIPEKENDFIYYNCNRTNEEGTKCEECINDNYIIVDGLCYNIANCAKIVDGLCEKCIKNRDAFSWSFQCLNTKFGCVDTVQYGCLRCNNNFNFFECSECKEGVELDEDGNCKIEYEEEKEEEKEEKKEEEKEEKKKEEEEKDEENKEEEKEEENKEEKKEEVNIY